MSRGYGVVALFGAALIAAGQDSTAEARRLETAGDAAGARRLLQQAAARQGAAPSAVMAYAEFLDQYGDTGAREAYRKAIPQATGADKRRALRRLVLLDMLAGDRAAASSSLASYREAGGSDLGVQIPSPPPPKEMPAALVPGPFTSFARMAALSPDLDPEELLPALARNIVTNGYQAANSNEALEQTEYLKLVFRYLSQARELEKLTGADKQLTIETCDSPKTGDLLKILGYRMRGACGGEVVLETVNASRAFLTIDSGFPLAELELALRTSRPFTHDFRPTRVPVLYGPEYWLGSGKEKQSGEFIDAFLNDPNMGRLYLGMSKLDPETAEELKKAIPVQRLRAFAHVIDFFGGMYLIRGGKAAWPGGPQAQAAWTELAGASPDRGADFYDKLIAKDDGWLGSYYDALMRIDGPVRDYLTEPERMKRFYAALRGRVTSPGPARPVFRANTDLMLLTTRLRLEPNGQPHVPGGVEVWRNLFVNHPHGKYDGKLTKAAAGWKTGEEVLEALFALCRKAVENEPLKMFMAISDINRHRAAPLDAATVDKIARSFRTFSSQLPVFAEVSGLSDKAVSEYLDTAQSIGSIRDQGVRADAAGTIQALTGLWQMLLRTGQVPSAQAEPLLTSILGRFAKARDSAAVFDAGRGGVAALLQAAQATSGSAQDRMLDLIAGTLRPPDEEAHTAMIQELTRTFEAQKLISLKLILDIADHADAIAKGEKLNAALLNRLSARLNEIQLPRASLTAVERNALSFGYWTERHIEKQRKLNIRAEVERAGADAQRLADARGTLAPILRDTLVGFNYLYYAPPGAQVLKTNPLFVRSHDFVGVQGTNQTWRQTEVLGTGWPSSAGGRLVGSLAGLGYALAEAEQNFLIPSREQALIWGDLVPQMILSAKTPRWWSATPAQVHWAGTHVRSGESLVAEGVLSAATRQLVVSHLARQASPSRVARVDAMLKAGDLTAALDNVTPAELVQIAMAAGAAPGASPSGSSEISFEAIARSFGSPKPILTGSFRPELLFLRTFPTLMGYSSRIMAESWESNALYFAALADELHVPPSRLNLLIPMWTASTVERIFATHLEDWPALLRSLRRVANEVRSRGREGAMASVPSGG